MTDSNPFSDSAIKQSLDKMQTPDKKGGDVEVRVNKDGVEAEGSVALNEHVSAGGSFVSTWNGLMDYFGIVKFKW